MRVVRGRRLQPTVYSLFSTQPSDTALCLTTSKPSPSSARKNSLRRATEITRIRQTIVSPDLERGDFAGDGRGVTSRLHRASIGERTASLGPIRLIWLPR